MTFSVKHRLGTWNAVIVAIFLVFFVRAFYLQVIRHDYYSLQAQEFQLKEYEVPASRGVIEAYNGDNVVALVLNEQRFTLFADPKFIEEPAEVAIAIANAIGGDNNRYEELLREDLRYVVLGKKLTTEQKGLIEELDIAGVGTRETEIRTYPQGTLAAHALGFVNDEGSGVYGVEQALHEELNGTPGQIRAITDNEGVPLVSNEDNVVIDPVPGSRVRLTIDVGLQYEVEQTLQAMVDDTAASLGSVVVMDPNSGAVKAFASYPTYDPAAFFDIEDPSIFIDGVAGLPLEVGSIMKPLTAAAALDTGAITAEQTYNDPGFYRVDGATITNVVEAGGAGPRSVQQFLQQSLNTGATWALMQMGGGDLNQRARETWHSYMTQHYGFGQSTGIELGYEAPGFVPDPNDGFGLNIQYANTSFGQGVQTTPLQMAAALSAVVNGGSYWQPRLVSTVDGEAKQPTLLRDQVVSAGTSDDMIRLMGGVMESNHRTYQLQLRDGYIFGGKTGTAQFIGDDGAYVDGRENGTFMGFVGGDKPEYVIVVRIDDPTVDGYAGSRAAAPVFSSIVDTLIEHQFVISSSQR